MISQKKLFQKFEKKPRVTTLLSLIFGQIFFVKFFMFNG